VDGPSARHLLRARDLIDARYGERPDVKDLARVATASPAHFSRSFAKAFGTPPHRYLTSRRIERAKHLLDSTDDSILTIGLAVGFESAASFSTAFGRVVGVSPRAYRRLNDGERAGQRDRPVPTCHLMAWTRPVLEVSTNRKEPRVAAD
jgi:AraC-like DNA-binding protein